MNLRDFQINKIVLKMKQMLARLEKEVNETKKIEEKWGLSVREARACLRKMRAKTSNEKAPIRHRRLSKADLQEIDRSG